MSEKIRLSPSQIDTLDRCAVQWFLGYVAKVRLKPSGKMSQGDAVDTGVTYNYERKIRSGADEPKSVIQDVVAETFERKKKETFFEPDEKPDKLKDGAIRLVGVYHEAVSPKVQPIAVQQSLNLEFPDQNYEVVQYADVLEDGRVRDTKVSGRRMNEEAAKSSFQLTSYAVGYETVMGSLPNEVVFDRLLRDAKGTPLQQVRAKVDAIDREGYLHKLKAVASRITAMEQEPLGLIYPADPARPNSPCSWCGFKRICLPAGKPWWKYLQGEEGIELARTEARKVLTEQRIASRISSSIKSDESPDMGGE